MQARASKGELLVDLPVFYISRSSSTPIYVFFTSRDEESYPVKRPEIRVKAEKNHLVYIYKNPLLARCELQIINFILFNKH